MVFSILALSGFEAPAPLAQESRRPGKFIGLAVTLSLLTFGLFYVFTSYASAIGWGTGNMAAFASNPNPYYALGHALWGAGWWLVVLAFVNSAIGTGMACTNSASRVMYTMGQAGTLPARFGRCIPFTRRLLSQLPFFRCRDGGGLAGWSAAAPRGHLRLSGHHRYAGRHPPLFMANLALTSYVRREHPDAFSFWQHAVFPWIGTLALLPVLFVTIYPVPSWPYNITPYLFVVLLIIGFGYMMWRELAIPGRFVGARRCSSA